MEHAKNEYDGARKEVANTREAQLKHVRKTDGKEDPQLDANERQARTVLAGEGSRISERNRLGDDLLHSTPACMPGCGADGGSCQDVM